MYLYIFEILTVETERHREYDVVYLICLLLYFISHTLVVYTFLWCCAFVDTVPFVRSFVRGPTSRVERRRICLLAAFAKYAVRSFTFGVSPLLCGWLTGWSKLWRVYIVFIKCWCLLLCLLRAYTAAALAVLRCSSNSISSSKLHTHTHMKWFNVSWCALVTCIQIHQ